MNVMPRAIPRRTASALAVLAIFAADADAELLVYEGFQYEEVGDELIGKPDDDGGTDAMGLAGTWQDVAADNGESNDMFLKAGSLAFGDLAGTGNHIGFQSNQRNDIYHRGLNGEAQAGVAATGELWFSFLVEKLQNNFSAGEGGFALTNQTLATPRIFENGGSAALDGLVGFGAGPTTAGNDWTAYAWDGTTKHTGDTAIAMPPANGNSNTAGSNFGDVRLIVGQIEFDIDPEGTDRYTLFNYQLNAGSVTGGSLEQIASPLEVLVDQSALDTLHLTRQVNLNWDEVRIGTTLASVLGAASGPEFRIQTISYVPGTEMVTLTWDSTEGETFSVRYSTDLNDWSGDLNDSVDADPGDRTTRTFNVGGLAGEGERLFIRVERN